MGTPDYVMAIHFFKSARLAQAPIVAGHSWDCSLNPWATERVTR